MYRYCLHCAVHYSNVTMSTLASQISGVLIVQAQIKENIIASRHWPLWGESTCGRWKRGKWFHLMTASWSNITYWPILWYNQARNTPVVDLSAKFCLFLCVRCDDRHIRNHADPPWVVLNKEWNFTTKVSPVLIQRFLHIGKNYLTILLWITWVVKPVLQWFWTGWV